MEGPLSKGIVLIPLESGFRGYFTRFTTDFFETLAIESR